MKGRHKPKESAAKQGLQGWWAGVRHELSAWGPLIRRFPSTAAVPLTIILLMVPLGIVGVVFLAQIAMNQAQGNLEIQAQGYTKALQLQLFQSFFPALGLAELVHIVRSPQEVVQQFPDAAARLFKHVPDGLLLHLSLAPSGVVSTVWPPEQADMLLGLDMLSEEDAQLRDEALFAIDYGQKVFEDNQQPLTRVTIPTAKAQRNLPLLVVQVPIFLQVGSNSSYTSLNMTVPTNCTSCYNASSGILFWGFAQAALSIDMLFPMDYQRQTETHLLRLLPEYYLHKAVSIERFGQVQRIISRTEPPAPEHNAAKLTFNITQEQQWVLYIYNPHDTKPQCYHPLVSLVIVVSLAVAILVFLALLSRHKHKLLLQALLPQEVILHLSKAAAYLKESQPNITSGSPINLILHMVAEVMQGRLPSVPDAMMIRTAILQGWNLHVPVNLKARLMQQGDMEEDVAQSLMKQLLDAKSRGSYFVTGTDQVIAHSSVPSRPGASSDFQELPATLQHLMAPENPDLTIDASEFLASFYTQPRLPKAARQANTDMQQGGLAPMASLSHQGSVDVGIPQPSHGSVSTDVASLGMMPLSAAEKCLSKAEADWQFDAFELAEVTNGFPLSTLGFYLFQRQGLVKRFKMDTLALARCLRLLEKGYNATNPYHNNTHAANVLQAFHIILHKGGMAPGYANPVTVLACYLAAIIHDYEHGGVTNDFLVTSQDALAYRYNDKAPLENHHAAAGLTLLRHPALNFLSNLSKPEQLAVRKLVIDLVLATDMKQHFALLSQYNTIHAVTASSGMLSASASDSNWSGSFAVSKVTPAVGPGSSEELPANVLVPVDETERLLSLQLALKCADLGHTAAALPVHKRWLAGLEEEFFRQGDKEAELGLPISALFDRTKPGASKSQVGFYNVVVVPLFNSFSAVFPQTQPLLQGVLANQDYWKELQQAPADTAPSGRASTAGTPTAAPRQGSILK